MTISLESGRNGRSIYDKEVVEAQASTVGELTMNAGLSYLVHIGGLRTCAG